MKEGNVTISNAGEKLTISGNISDEKGNVEITNNGAKGAEISGEVLLKRAVLQFPIRPEH